MSSEPQGADGPHIVALIDTLTRQIAQRQSGDDARFISFSETVDARFRTVHEDGRRDRRETLERLDKMASGIRADMRAGYTAIDRRLAQVCDKGGEEHREFRDDILTLTERMNTAEAQAQGRGQVLAFMGKGVTWGFEHGWKAIVVIAALATVVKQWLPEPPRSIDMVAAAQAGELPPLELRD